MKINICLEGDKMIPGMGRMNPAQMQKMMKQLGIQNEEIDANRVVFELNDGSKLVFDNPSVSAVNMQGQKTYTVMGEAHEEEAGLPEEDVKMVMEQAGVSKEEAEEALEEAEGNIAGAIVKLKK